MLHEGFFDALLGPGTAIVLAEPAGGGAHQRGIFRRPEFGRIFFIIAVWSHEETLCHGPEIGHEGHALAGKGYHGGHIIFFAMDPVLFQDGDKQTGQFFGRFHPQVFAVVPVGLLHAETGAGTDDAVQRECLHQLIHGEDFPVIAGIPAQEGQ